ncbi:MAG: AAA family ATPase [Oligoflexia bacterium]|nr:AAA family ATPase [Oligoflexia bacterium]
MDIVILDNSPESRAGLSARVHEALRQAELEQLGVAELDTVAAATHDWSRAAGCLIGPGAFADIDDALSTLRLAFPNGRVAVVVEPDVYSRQAVLLRKRLNIPILSIADITQLASFLIECESANTAVNTGPRNKGVVGVCHLKGGVGATTVTAALGSCWARHGLSVCAIDLDDVNPQLTAWGRVGISQRTVTAELLRQGEVPANRINELVFPVEGYEGRLVVVGQPEAYNEGFHFKANVLDGSPSSSEFMSSLIGNLTAEFDAVIIDMSRSWGVAAFSTLPLCQNLLLVTDDDGMSVRRTLDCLQRLRKESDDPDEFDFSRWSLVLNGYTGRLISPKEIALEIQEMELFPSDASLFTVPFSDSGRQWGAPGQSFYDTADPKTREVVRKMAATIVPFRYEPEQTGASKILRKVQSLVHQD